MYDWIMNIFLYCIQLSNNDQGIDILTKYKFYQISKDCFYAVAIIARTHNNMDIYSLESELPTGHRYIKIEM